MIEREPGPDWRDLQRRVVAILAECGFAAEEAKQLPIARGNVEVDVYAIDRAGTPPTVYFCECKRWATRVPQGEVQTFRTVMSDGGAHVGLFISSAGFQAGAFEVVRHTNVHLLDWSDFQAMFAERWCEQYWVPTLRDGADRLAGYVEAPMSDAVIRFERGEYLEPAEAIGLLVSDMWGDPFLAMPGFDARSGPLVPAIWRHRDKYREHMPPVLADLATLRELLDGILRFYQTWLRESGRG